VKRVAALLLSFGYKMQTHFVLHISLRNWLWGLAFVPAAAAFLRRLPWLHAVLLSLLGALLLAGIELARQNGYLVFEPAVLRAGAGPLPRIEVDELVPCHASGPFAVADRQRYMVNERAQISYVRTREHIVMAHIARTRFLLFARSTSEDVGWWYVFIKPDRVQHVETGHILCGFRSRPGLEIRYLAGEKAGQLGTVYLGFDDVRDLVRVLDDLRLDVAAAAFEGPAPAHA
jgi:hypothetical protein